MPRRTPQEELDMLLQHQAALKADLKEQQARLRQAALAKRADLAGRIRRTQTRLSHQDRRQRTRRLILLGTLIEHEIAQRPAERTRVMARLEAFLTRDRDLTLFDLPAKQDTAATAADPLPGWRPHRLDNGDWGSLYAGDTSGLPAELVGARITVQPKQGPPWTATVTAVLARSRDQVLVSDSGRPVRP